ncbi:MAG TPA: nitrilase-related carbon-nitrogen hydrolase [Thermoanaerobaculia bacterium]|nr:nitrilase-related carbon-nitrogen hydrolase [Thermoanaerobaculia bacterium]
MRIALAQLAASPDRTANLDRVTAAMQEAKQAGADLVAFPEVVLDRFFPVRPNDRAALALAEPIPGPVTDRIAALARELGIVTVFNLYEVDSAGRRFDSSPVFDADGRLLGVTRMLHITDYEGFHEQSYYHPGDLSGEAGLPVYDTRVGRIGVAICYDRHYPEVMRSLGVQGAELVVIPQAGTVGEWPEGMYEAEVRTAGFQNGYFTALCNRVGNEGALTFAGESFLADPEGRILARGGSLREDLVVCDVDLGQCAQSTARRLFFRHRRPDLYRHWLG